MENQQERRTGERREAPVESLAAILDQYRRGARGLPSYDELRAFAEADAAARAAPGVPAAPAKLMPNNTYAAREFLVKWMEENFLTDTTFGNYIRTDLAGDFAYQLARALAASGVASSQAEAKCMNCGAGTVEDCNSSGCGGLEDGNCGTDPTMAHAAPAGINQQAGGAVPVGLPPLPEPWIHDMNRGVQEAARKHYAEDQMIDYGKACFAAGSALAVPVQADRMPETAAKPADGSDPMPKRTAFLAWCKSRALDTETEKDAWGALQFKHSHIQALWEGWFNAPAAPLQVGPSEAMLIRAFNGGYMAGHNDTVESQYTDIDRRDMFTYHADTVAEMIADGTLAATPVAPPSSPENK